MEATPLKPTNELLVRKKRFRTEMDQTSIKESYAELKELAQRNISPATRMFFNGMIEVSKSMDELEPNQVEWHQNAGKLLWFESMLDDRLSKDLKYQEIREDFEKLTAANFLLRYADYYRGNLHEIKLKSKELAKAAKKKDIFAGNNWKQIHDLIQKEEKQRDHWLLHESKKGIPSPPTPISMELHALATEVNMPWNEMHFQIKAYAERCNRVHSGIEEAVALGLWTEVANYIIHDRAAIEKGAIPFEMLPSSDLMLAALQRYQERYFKRIETAKQPLTEYLIVSDYVKADTLQEKLQRAEEKKERAKQQEEKIANHSGILEAAKESETDDPEILKEGEVLVTIYKELEEARMKVKAAQKELGQFEKKFRSQAVKYVKLVELKGKGEEKEDEPWIEVDEDAAKS